MSYSLVAIMALIIHLIIHQSLLWKSNDHKANGAYRALLFSIIGFFLTDILWGIFYELHWMMAVNVDTYLYFAAMSTTVFLWMRFVVVFCGGKLWPRRIFLMVGALVSLTTLGLLIANIFTPIFFFFDEAGVFVGGTARYGFLGLQTLIYTASSVYAVVILLRRKRLKESYRLRYWVVVLFGLIMTAAIGIQMFYPLLPLYAVGFAISTSVSFIFLITTERQERAKELFKAHKREELAEEELGSTKMLVYKDPLTGAKSRYAYVEMEMEMDKAIAENSASSFAVVVFDLNDLKKVNDTQGHQAGDKYILSSYAMIQRDFPAQDIYRFGGDEFAILLQGEQYRDRERLLNAFNLEVDNNLKGKGPIVATGMAEFLPGKDNTFRAVFVRADERMYTRKRTLKAMK